MGAGPRAPRPSAPSPARGEAAHQASVPPPYTPQGGADSEDDDDDEEELGDEAMMALDKSLASLFAEQKLRIQARKDEKNKLQKEKALRRDFQIRVSPGPALPLTTPLPLPSPQRLAELTLLTTGPRPDRGAGDQAAREPPGPGAARAAAARHPAEHAQQQQRQAGAGPAAQDGPHLHVRAAGLPDGGVGARGPHHSGAFTHLFLQCLAQGPQSHRRPQGHCS